MSTLGEPLTPYSRAEAVSLAQAAEMAGRSRSTLRDWCLSYRIGRHVGGRWMVSRVALAMFLDGDRAALEAYLNRERGGVVADYFARVGVGVPA